MSGLLSRLRGKSKKEESCGEAKDQRSSKNIDNEEPESPVNLSSKEPESPQHLLVAAFDFGTTYSGYAFSFRDDPMNIKTNNGWNAGSEKLISLKTPTCILLTPTREFHSFGYDAENKYASLAEDDKHHDWLLFRRFKMLLHNNQGLSRNATVEDISGKTMPALTIFAMAIGYLRDHLLKTLNTQITGVAESDIKYVLTVPAIWSDKAKQFMREAAMKAMIDSDRLELALEPEAASIWCQTVSTEVGKELSGAGTQYMVVDLGGGTVDISVHEKLANGSLRELHKASGGPWGGNAVDQNYLAWLTSIFGKPAIERFKKEQMTDFFDILREFETKKRAFKRNTEGKITFRVSASLQEMSREIKNQSVSEKIASLDLNNMVISVGDKLRVDPSIVKTWFQDPIDQTVSHIHKILSEPIMTKVNTIIVVGGFGECELVQADIRAKLPDKRLIVPEEPGLAVLKGAVRFGHMPRIIASRIASRTYGIEARVPFDPNIHLSSKVIVDQGEKYVDGIFEVYVKQGDEVSIGHQVRNVYSTGNRSSTRIKLVSSDKPDPKYIDDPGCQQLGYLEVSHNGEDEMFEVILFFGDTELHVIVKMLQSNTVFKTVIDCL